MSLQTYIWQELGSAQRAQLLARPDASQNPSILRQARGIIHSVKANGDSALREFSATYDNASVEEFRVAESDIAAAAEELTLEQRDAIEFAIANVRKFHAEQLPIPLSVETIPGVRCERVSHALDSVGLYVPSGSAPLPSAAIMLAVPAAIAACPRIVLCTPPRPDGSADPAVLTAASISGVTEIYTLGGAQAIAAMAYGTESVPKVRKIFGPGNAWVTAAKSLVSVDPAGAAIDMPAGPSEVLVIADSSASAPFVASDLLSQAEHGSDSQVVLITTDPNLADAVNSELDRQLRDLSRAQIASQALQNSRTIVAESLQNAVSISNRYAPEHLILQTAAPRDLLPFVRNAGSIFIGPWTPESVGDYCSGTNHVLPTYGHAATFSGLGVEQFMRHMTIQEASRDGLQALAPALHSLTELEGLDAHAAAVRYRLEATT